MTALRVAHTVQHTRRKSNLYQHDHISCLLGLQALQLTCLIAFLHHAGRSKISHWIKKCPEVVFFKASRGNFQLDFVRGRILCSCYVECDLLRVI